MPKILKSPQIWLYVVLALVCIAAFLILWGAKLPGDSVTPDNSSSTASGSSANTATSGNPQVGLQDPAIAAKYDLVGIKSDDTVAVVSSSEGSEIVINLEHKQWKNPRWSPDGKLIAVLGETTASSSATKSQTQSSFDLYIYNLADSKWTQATAYNQSQPGVSGYQWQDATTITFTQGNVPDDWVHSFSFTSNEIKKIFKVTGSLSFFAANPNRYITLDNSDPTVGQVYRVYSDSGKVEFTFVGRAIVAESKIVNMLPAADNASYVFDLGNNGLYFWSFNDPNFVSPKLAFMGTVNPPSISRLNLLCTQKNNYTVWTLGGDSRQIVVISLQQSGDYDVIESLTATSNLKVEADKASCNNDRLLLEVLPATAVNDDSSKWYTFEQRSVKEIVSARGYAELRVK